MAQQDTTLLKDKADKLEKDAKNFLKDKEYTKAIACYEQMIDIYRKIGWKGQLGILRKEIIRIESLRSLELQNKLKNGPANESNNSNNLEKQADSYMSKAKKHAFSNEFDKAIECYKSAYEIFEKLGYSFQLKRINWEIEKLKDLKEKFEEKQKNQLNSNINKGLDDNKSANIKSDSKKSEYLTIAEERTKRLMEQRKKKEAEKQKFREKEIEEFEKKKRLKEEQRRKLMEEERLKKERDAKMG